MQSKTFSIVVERLVAYQSKSGANTKNTMFPEHVSLSMKIVATCTNAYSP